MRNPWYKVPALKKELGMSDAKYRAILKQFGLSSSKEISDYDQTLAIMDAMRGKKPVVKAKVDLSKILPPAKPAVPWNWFDATPDQWKNMGEMIHKMDAIGISLVAVQSADGSRRFKYRVRRV